MDVVGFHHVTTHKSCYPTQLLKWKVAIFRLCVACFSNVGELFSDKKDKWYFSPHNLLKISLSHIFINQIENFRDCNSFFFVSFYY